MLLENLFPSKLSSAPATQQFPLAASNLPLFLLYRHNYCKYYHREGMLAIEIDDTRPLAYANHGFNSWFYILRVMSILRLLGSRKPRKLPEPEQLPQEVNGQLHVEFRSTVRQLVVVRSCLNEDGEASVELPPESPASDGEEEEGGEHESEALNATAVLLVREHQIVSVALDVARTSACGSGGSTNQRTGCGHSGLSHPISYQLTVFVSGGSGKMTTEHSLSSQTKPRPSLEGREAEHPKSSKAGLGVFESLLEKTGRLKLRERWSAAVKQSTRFFITLNSSHEDPEREFRLLGPVELPVGTSWLSAIMEGQPDLEWVVLK